MSARAARTFLWEAWRAVEQHTPDEQGRPGEALAVALRVLRMVQAPASAAHPSGSGTGVNSGHLWWSVLCRELCGVLFHGGMPDEELAYTTPLHTFLPPVWRRYLLQRVADKAGIVLDGLGDETSVRASAADDACPSCNRTQLEAEPLPQGSIVGVANIVRGTMTPVRKVRSTWRRRASAKPEHCAAACVRSWA